MEREAELPPKGWIPFRLRRAGEALLVDWLFTAQELYTDPFFEDTIAACRSLPENGKRHRPASTLSFLPVAAERADSIAPSAFIFHVSRCGSTLYTQLLAQDETHIVLSEVPLFEEIIRLPAGREQRIELLRSAISLYAQRRNGNEQRLFVKLDAWHLYDADLVRAAFPETPFIFLYREPSAVIRSHARQRGMHMVPGILHHPVDEANIESLDAYAMQVLRGYYEYGLALCSTDKAAHAVNYSEGPLEGLLRVCGRSGIFFTDALRARMQERSQTHSKYPGQKFQEAPAEKFPAEEFYLAAQQAYEKLEALREQQQRLR